MATIDCGDYRLHTHNLFTSEGKNLIISSHGGWQENDGQFSPLGLPFTVRFFALNHHSVGGDLIDAINGKINAITAPVGPVHDYELSWFEHDPSDDEISAALSGKGVDVITIKKDHALKFRALLQQLNTRGFKYPLIQCLFCRYTGGEQEMDARQPTAHEQQTMQNVEAQRRLMMAVMAAQK